MRTAVELPVVGLIYNRYKNASATQDAVVEIRVYYQRKTKYMSTRVRLLPKEWKNGLVVNRVDAIILNKQLDKLLVDIRKVIYDMYEEGNIDIDAIPARLMAKRKPSVAFIEFCEQRSKIRKYGKTADSQERYERFMRFLKEYGKFKTFYDLTEQKVMELDRYLQKKNDMKAKSRWNNYHRFLNSFIMDAQKEGLLQLNPYDRVMIDKGNDYDGIDKCLEPEEFEQLRTAKMPDARLERVRDLFVFHCYLCQGYKDLQSFNVKNIKEVDGKKVYTGKRGKTGVEFTVPLLSPALAILDKYHGKLPILSNVKYNKYVKEVAVIVGLPDAMTTHWARHTGGTLLLNAGVPMGIVSKVLGHRSIKMTERIYAKWLPKTIVNEVNKVAIKTEAKEKFDKLTFLAVDAVKAANSDRTALENAFNDYFDWYEDQVQRENLPTFGGAPGSQQNRAVLAGQITRTVKFGNYGLDEHRLTQLRKILNDIIDYIKE
jgi:integrase